MRHAISLRTMFLVLVSLAIFCAQPLPAQDRAGTLQGVVKDGKGAPVTGAFVKMHNAERRLTFMIISQEQGRLWHAKLAKQKFSDDYL